MVNRSHLKLPIIMLARRQSLLKRKWRNLEGRSQGSIALKNILYANHVLIEVNESVNRKINA